jgi:hypothetical protein
VAMEVYKNKPTAVAAGDEKATSVQQPFVDSRWSPWLPLCCVCVCRCEGRVSVSKTSA